MPAKESFLGITDSVPAAEPQAADQTSAKSLEAEEHALRAQYIHLQGTKEHYSHKKYWSWFLMLAVGSMIVFQSVLLVSVGTGRLDFTGYAWLMPALLIQNLGQVVGLAIYAVRYLFSDISRQV